MIDVRDLTKQYGKYESAVIALNHVSLTVQAHEMTAVIGKSGSGKTTLLNLLGGLDTPTGGSVVIGGTDITKLNDTQLADFRLRHIGFVFQFFDLLPELTAAENILLPAKLAHLPAKQFDALTAQLGLSDRLTHYPAQLSGGQQQRAAIARALINQPDVLLCDEPTGALDSKTAAEIMEVLKELNRTGTTIIIVTHDKSIAQQCGRIMEIADGCLVSDA